MTSILLLRATRSPRAERNRFAAVDACRETILAHLRHLQSTNACHHVHITALHMFLEHLALFQEDVIRVRHVDLEITLGRQIAEAHCHETVQYGRRIGLEHRTIEHVHVAVQAVGGLRHELAQKRVLFEGHRHGND